MSDIFTEVFHYKYSRITCYIAFIMNLFMVGAFALMKILPAGGYLIYYNSELIGFEAMILDTFYMLIAFTAFIIGDFMNDYVFSKMKGNNNSTNGYSFRAIISTICGQILDSTIFFWFRVWCITLVS